VYTIPNSSKMGVTTLAKVQPRSSSQPCQACPRPTSNSDDRDLVGVQPAPVAAGPFDSSASTPPSRHAVRRSSTEQLRGDPQAQRWPSIPALPRTASQPAAAGSPARRAAMLSPPESGYLIPRTCSARPTTSPWRATSIAAVPVELRSMRQPADDIESTTLVSVSVLQRLFRYVGPRDLLDQVRTENKGQGIHSPSDLNDWISNQTAQDPSEPFTYVVDSSGILRLAPRRSEHVACAGGEPVLAAGEVSFQRQLERWDVVEVSNQSTGYCPDVDSWPAVADALERAGLAHPQGFTSIVVFRRCPTCCQLNIVRDGEFICLFCDDLLPQEWNIDDET